MNSGGGAGGPGPASELLGACRAPVGRQQTHGSLGQVPMSQLSGGNKWHSWFGLNHRHLLSPSWTLESETHVPRGGLLMKPPSWVCRRRLPPGSPHGPRVCLLSFSKGTSHIGLDPPQGGVRHWDLSGSGGPILEQPGGGVGQGQRAGSGEGCLAGLWPPERDSSLAGVAQRTDTQCLCPLTPMAGHVPSSESAGDRCTQSIKLPRPQHGAERVAGELGCGGPGTVAEGLAPAAWTAD